jgi:hypothetical protein
VARGGAGGCAEHGVGAVGGGKGRLIFLYSYGLVDSPLQVSQFAQRADGPPADLLDRSRRQKAHYVSWGLKKSGMPGGYDRLWHVPYAEHLEPYETSPVTLFDESAKQPLCQNMLSILPNIGRS